MTRHYSAIHLAWIVLIAISSMLAVAGCSGGGAARDVAPPEMALPPLPAGDTSLRQGAALDSDTVDGDQYLVCEGGTDDGNMVHLEPGTTPGNNLAYAIYEIPARPDPAVPYMLTVAAFYADDDPMTMGEGEGYYVAYGNYNTASWVISGPYYKSITRIPFAPGTDVTSPADNVYIAVIAYNGAMISVVLAQVGYDAGPGWEEHIVSPTQGVVAGVGCDIAVDPAGNPQVAYQRVDSVLLFDQGPIYVAKQNGPGWELEEATSDWRVRVVQLALGDGGRRALLIEDRDLDNFRLLWDSDGDGFDNDILIDPLDDNSVRPSVAFCNGADNPSGELDTAIVVYAVPAGPNITVRYLRYDGGAATGGDVIAATPEVRAIDLYTADDLSARIALPISPAPPAWDLHFGTYAAATDGWSFGTPPDWTAVQTGPSGSDRVVRACQTGAGEYAAAYLLEERAGLQIGLSSSGPFSSQPEDRHLGGIFENDFELESYTDGSVAHLVPGGNYTLAMYRGFPDSGTAWNFRQITTEPLGCSLASFAVDGDDVSHFAVLNPSAGRLDYYRLDQFDELTSSVVDTGSGQPGLAFGPAPVAATGDDFYLFYNDASRLRILYSRCSGGQWEEEGVPLNAPGTFPYLMYGAGYLEDLDLLYVVYLDFYDINISVLSCPPGENDWHREEFAVGYTSLVGLADNEREVAIAHPMEGPVMEEALAFTKGDPRYSPDQAEAITTSTSNIEDPWYLDYSPADGHWGLVTNGSVDHRVSYYERGDNGIWGPAVEVAATSGVGAFIQGVGLTHDAADGTARVVLRQGPTGPLPYEVNVMRELPGGGFALENTVTTVDAGAVESEPSLVIKGIDGLPHVVVPTLAPASYWEFEIFSPDGLGGWASETVWSSSIADILEGEFGVHGGLDETGMPVVTATEMDETADYFGIVSAYHYW